MMMMMMMMSEVRQQNVSVRTTTSNDLQEEGWFCTECTFLNHPALDVCEICSFQRTTASAEGEFLTGV